MTPKEQKIFDMQSPSTKACLSRPREKDAEWFSRPIPANAQCVKEDGSVDLNAREISVEEYGLHEHARRGRGELFESARANYLNSAKINDKLKKDIDTLHVMPSEEKRQKAIDAFMSNLSLVDRIKNAFKQIMGMNKVEKPKQYAEIVAESMRKLSEE